MVRMPSDSLLRVSAWDRLTPRHRAFLSYYLEHFNATRAYQQLSPGIAPGVAAASASRLLKDVNVKEALAEQMDLLGMTPARIKAAHAAIIEGDIADFEPLLDGTKTLAQLQADGVATHVIRRVRRRSRTARDANGKAIVVTETEIEFYDRQRSLEAMTRILHMLGDDDAFAMSAGVEVHIHLPPTDDDAREAPCDLNAPPPARRLLTAPATRR